MGFSNQTKINIANGMVSIMNSLQAAGSVKNHQGAFNLAVINLLEKLAVEMADKMTEEEFISELELVLANEDMASYNLAKSAAEVKAQQRQAQELALQEKLNLAKAQRDSKRGPKGGK